VDPYAQTAMHPVASAGAPSGTTAPRPVVASSPDTARPVRRQSPNGQPGRNGNGGNGNRRRQEPDERRGGWGGRILILLALLALLSVIAMAQFLIKPAVTGGDDDNSDDAPPPATSAPVSKVVKIVGAKDFDPEPDGNGEEHPDEVPDSYDGKKNTSWTTMSYKRRADLGGQKEGVGVIYDLGAVTSVSQVTVTLGGEPTDLEIRIPSGDTAKSPEQADDWEAVAKLEEGGEVAVLKPTPGTRTRYVLVWLTSLPKDGDGYRGEIAEVSIQR
jgi:hypothetical protein